MANEPNQDPLPLGRMAFHGALAAVVFFTLNRYGLAQTVEQSLMWAVIAAPFAAYIAYTQARR